MTNGGTRAGGAGVPVGKYLDYKFEGGGDYGFEEAFEELVEVGFG